MTLVQTIENQIFSKAAPIAIRYLGKPDLNTKDPLARKVFDQAKLEFQLAPPVTVHATDPHLMAGIWSATREAYLVNHSGRKMREAIAAAVSAMNECPYCVTVHSSLFNSTGGNAKQMKTPEHLAPEIRAAYDWASTTLTPNAMALAHPDIPRADIPQLYGTAVMYHYVNRVVSVFLAETPVALPGMGTALGQKVMRASFTFFGKRFANLDPVAGQFILDNDPELPEEFQWASSNKNVAKGLAQFAFAAESAGLQSVPDEVRNLVTKYLEGWQGEEAPLSRQWINDLVEPLSDANKSSGRLALLTARAAWQVDESLIKDFSNHFPTDKQLLQTVAWASYAATQKISSWLKLS